MKRKHGKEPKCEECIPPLLPENEETLKVFNAVRWQVVSVGETVVDLDIPAVYFVMDKFGIVNQSRCFELVRKVFHHFLDIDNKERERKLKK